MRRLLRRFDCLRLISLAPIDKTLINSRKHTQPVENKNLRGEKE